MSKNSAFIDISDLVKFLDIGERRIQQLAKDGHLPKSVKGKYPYPSTVVAYIRYLQNKGSGSNEYNDGRARKIQAEASAKEMANELRAKSLYEKSDTDPKLAEAFKMFQQSIITLPDVAERDAGLSSQQVVFLTEVVDSALSQLAKTLKNISDTDHE